MPASELPRPSFSAEVKEELAHIWPQSAPDRQAELAGLVRACGTLELAGAGRISLRLSTDHNAVARKALQLLKHQHALAHEVRVERRTRLRKNLRYIVRVPPQPGLHALLTASAVLDAEGRIAAATPDSVRARESCCRAYLRGFFLGAGWVSPPERSHHLEMTCPEADFADALGQLLFDLKLPVRVAARKQQMVLYLKEGDQIARFLALVGAHRHYLRYEDVRVLKEMRGQINRQVNAETANLGKAVDAAARQIEAIRSLQASGRLDRLPRALRELADLRLKYPEVSLRELGELCSPPVGKSGVNHRMRLLLKLAGDSPQA